jgi:hypothetical protein
VEEVTASAQSLTAMAQALQQIVAQFTLAQTDTRTVTSPVASPTRPAAPKPVVGQQPAAVKRSNGHPAERGVNGRYEDVPVR